MKPIKWKIENNKLLVIATLYGGFCPTQLFDEAIQLNNGLIKVRKGNLWGCLNEQLDTIIPVQYLYIEERNYDSTHNFILAGRDGETFQGIRKWSVEYPTTINTIFTGVYDLYDLNGDFLFGGFSDFNYNQKVNLFLFVFGRQWEISPAKHWNDSNEYNYSDVNGKWIILNEDFLVPFRFSFYTDKGVQWNCFKGASIKSSIHKMCLMDGIAYPEKMVKDFKSYQSNHCKDCLLIDLPEGTLFDEIVDIKKECIVVKKDNKYKLISLKSNAISLPFDSIEILTDEYAVVSDGYPIGLLRDGKLEIPCEYTYITVPINGWCFLFKNYPKGKILDPKYYGILFDLNNKGSVFTENKGIPVVENLDQKTLMTLIDKLAFKLVSIQEGKSDLETITLYNDEGKEYIITSILQKLGHFTKIERTLHKDNKFYGTDYCCSAEYHYELKHPEEYSSDEGIDYYGIEDALDGEWEAMSNID